MLKNFFDGFYLDEKLNYFIEYYLYLIKQYNDGLVNFTIFNLHSICQFIKEELTYNASLRNIKLLSKKLRNNVVMDYFSKNEYKLKIEAILQSITTNKEYTLIIVNSLLKEIEDGKYAKKLCDRIVKLLFSKKELNNVKEEVKYLTNSLIIEYLILGYNSSEIESFIINIFSNYSEVNGEYFTNYPIPNNISGNKIKKYILSLTNKERINALKKYIKIKVSTYYYLFTVDGIVGDLLDIKLNNVNIYNYRNKAKFNIEREGNTSPIYENGKYKEKLIHCTVKVESIGKNNAIEKVKEEVENALDILHKYHDVRCKIDVNYSYYILFDKSKNIIGEGMTRKYDENFKKIVNAINYNHKNDNDYTKLQKNYNNYSKYIINNHSKTSNILKQSLRYYRKAKESFKIEDSILNYWICIENIFKFEIEVSKSVLDKDEKDNKFNNIISFFPMVVLYNEIIEKYWNIYHYFSNKGANYKHYIIKKFNKNELNKLQFKIGNVDLRKFLKNMNILKDKIITTLDREIYNDAVKKLNDINETKLFVSEIIDKTKEHLILLYRYRNMIVHNAYCNFYFSEYLQNRFDYITIELLNMITENYCDNKAQKNIEEIIIEKYICNQELKEKLKTETLEEWFMKL